MNEFIEIFTITGEKVLQQECAQFSNNARLYIDTGNLQKGIYVFRVNTITGNFMKKIVISGS
ncbi:MAG: T9SS type A sorting domain-containing protein [Bacteroidales bacterium]|nr:T9SS type A sorting domain-containing protein [Bacteroidales bacterium]